MCIRDRCGIALLGSHVGDVGGFLVGKSLGPTLLNSKFIQKRQKPLHRAQKFLDRFGPYTVLVGRFIPAIRPLVPFMLGVTDLKLKNHRNKKTTKLQLVHKDLKS